ncbi:MAG: hypothetical protein R3C15_16245 [Thermoleophilia bacterium]
MRTRIALAAALAAVAGLAIALAVVLSGGDDDGPPSAAPATAAEATGAVKAANPGPQPPAIEPVASGEVPLEPAAGTDGAAAPTDTVASAQPASAPASGEGGQGAVSSPLSTDARFNDYDPSCIETLQHEFGCFEAYLVDVIEKEGAPASLAALRQLSEQDPWVLNECHPLVHSIGRYSREIYGSLQATLKYEDGTCWSGFTHGALEREMFSYTMEELPNALRSMCSQDPDQPYSFDYYNCVHGLGHGLSWRFQNSVFKSLPFCDELEGSWEQQSCYSGVFMQNIVTDGAMHVSQDLKADEPMYPCTAVDRKYKTSCYLMQTSYALRLVDYDYKRGFELCDELPSPSDSDFVPICYRSMGRDISGNFNQDTNKIIEYCSLGAADLQGMCIAGAVKNDVFNDHGVERANELCAAVPDRLRADCEQARDEAASSL